MLEKKTLLCVLRNYGFRLFTLFANKSLSIKDFIDNRMIYQQKKFKQHIKV